MHDETGFEDYTGHWKGINNLYLSWLDDQLFASESEAVVALKANGQFVQFDYNWTYKDEKQEGLLVLGIDRESNAAQVVWTDSWHSKHKFLVSDGALQTDDTISVLTSYQIGEHPPWGWRTEILKEPNAFQIVMYNIPPNEEEILAVEMKYERAG